MARTVLFSNKNVADIIKANYEPVWENVRPVPLVTIDFGNGKVINRTMQGNIATYICLESGRVLDVLPGLYEPIRFEQCLQEIAQQYRRIAVLPEFERARAVRHYHKQEEQRVPIREIAGPVSNLLTRKIFDSEGVNRRNILAWTEIYQDTIANEVVVRKGAHAMLADMPPPFPSVINKRVYRELMHTDLDDPYLGMGASLFASYPFDR